MGLCGDPALAFALPSNHMREQVKVQKCVATTLGKLATTDCYIDLLISFGLGNLQLVQQLERFARQLMLCWPHIQIMVEFE